MMLPSRVLSVETNRVKTLVALGILWAGIMSPVKAHPPSKPELQYDPKTQILTVSVPHAVSDPTTHYISKIEVTLGKKSLALQEGKSQTDKAHLATTFTLKDVKVGDELVVKAKCNRFGSRTAKLVIPEEGR